jgi:CO/xanthine dehydrogenase FAD-binding subunit
MHNRGALRQRRHASPAGDTLPVLAVMEAAAVLASPEGERRVRYGILLRLPRYLMRLDELITAIEIPEVEGEQCSGRWEPARRRPSPR